MLVVARQYSTVIDDVTECRALKLQKFELSETQWKIVDDLLHVLKVRGGIFICSFTYNPFRSLRTPLFSSLRMPVLSCRSFQ